MANQDYQTLAETEQYLIWTSNEEGGQVYHLELGNITIHFLPEEWDEFVELMTQALR
ncbi:MAG: hypothetical protein N2559_17985 [Anaerolineae bacterium]|nr:hypothetical protein [Anaerolineae bacterium]